MSENNENNTHYTDDDTERLEIIWGEGFLSPGGPGEVVRVLGDQEITGCNVLDIGSGAGGVDIVLVKEHGVGSVVGIDVEQKLIDLAVHRLQSFGLENQITYQLVEPGPLPFTDETFDIIFSKDAIIHIPDKYDIYSEALRVMRPGGRIFVSDWLRGDGNAFDKTVEKFIEHRFSHQ
jgi:phosphoethanolamine N-methyltransferase